MAQSLKPGYPEFISGLSFSEFADRIQRPIFQMLASEFSPAEHPCY